MKAELSTGLGKMWPVSWGLGSWKNVQLVYFPNFSYYMVSMPIQKFFKKSLEARAKTVSWSTVANVAAS
jgi:hypothetical protein